MRTKLHELADLGQSVWLDYIHRSLIQSGGLRNYVDKGLRGVTSNPTIFEKAIAESKAYDEQIHQLATDGKSAQEIYEALIVEDARTAADVLHPVYDESNGRDGFFSLEVDPHLAHEAGPSMSAARRLFNAVDRPNIMIKIPATPECMSAIRALTAEGINLNITLIFSLKQYNDVAEAYLSGLEERVATFHEIKQTTSVASIFVSRLDGKVDELLDQIGSPEAKALKGRIGIANAKMVYQRFKEIFSGDRWDKLVQKNAYIQRVLYGSTGTKNKAYSDVMYVEHLIGPNTVNTMPPETIAAFLDHGKVAVTIEDDLDQEKQQLAQFEQLGVHLNDVTDQLLEEGLEKFDQPYDTLIKTIEEKRVKLVTT